MTLELFSALVAFAFATSITPGPNNLMLLASGMNFGLVRTVPHLSGIVIGFPTMVFLVGVGLMQIFDAIPYSYTILRTVSAVYLCYLAWRIATAVPKQTSNGSDAAEDAGRPFSFLQAASFQWVNPKSWTMALTAVSVYAPPLQPALSSLVVALVFAAIALPAMLAWTLIGQQLRRFLSDPRRQRAFNITCATLLVLSLVPMLAGAA